MGVLVVAVVVVRLYLRCTGSAGLQRHAGHQLRSADRANVVHTVYVPG
jgi:hypothetical protein